MPFWKREKDPELEAAEAHAEAALPRGWKIYLVDRERFATPGGRVDTYGVCAAGPGDSSALAVAIGKVNAYRAFVRLMGGDLEVTEDWAVPLSVVHAEERTARFSLRSEGDPHVIAAKEELDAALPAGWELFANEQERYSFPSGYLEGWGVAVRGPAGEAELAVGVGEAGGMRAMARRLRGELEVADAWAPPMHQMTLR